MKNVNVSYALVTGASNGIGKSIATALARKGVSILLIARSEKALQEHAAFLKATYHVEAHYLVTDLSLPNAALLVKNWCEEQQFRVHIVVNNAGYGIWGRFDTLALAEQANMLQLNMQTLVEMCYHFLPALKAEKKSYILNIASAAAYQAVPGFGLYAASKAFVLSFSRALRFELKDTPVSVTCVCPGPVNTGFVDRAGLSFMKVKAEKLSITPDEAARHALNALFANKAEVVPGWLNKLAVFFIPFVPKSVVEKIAFGLYKA